MIVEKCRIPLLLCEELFPDAVQILDFYHFSENVHEYAKAIYPENEVIRKAWVNKLLGFVTRGEVTKAANFIEKHTLINQPEGTVNLPLYINNNIKRIDYKYFKDNKYYIESGNKTVIQKRMKQSGMWWRLSGGQYIATLRGKYKSDLWDEVKKAIEAL
ncbi:hypothetical protein AB8U03_09700 [Clostridium sp. Mt-5]|uniref:Transposase n=1 Tax=Clostridium moutaii TaxID=3240932 RepID=A0ABV4BQX2_9CLOT